MRNNWQQIQCWHHSRPPAAALLLRPCPTFHHLIHPITGCRAGLPKDRAWLMLHQLQELHQLCFGRSQKGFLSPKTSQQQVGAHPPRCRTVWLRLFQLCSTSCAGCSSLSPAGTAAAQLPRLQPALKFRWIISWSIPWSVSALREGLVVNGNMVETSPWWGESPGTERNFPSLSLGFPVNSPYFINLL